MSEGNSRIVKFTKDSLYRRSLILLTTTVPGLLLNFGLIILAAHILDVEIFGVFYLGLTIAAVLSSPAAVVAFFLARRFGEIRATSGDIGVYKHVRGSFQKYMGLLLAGGGAVFVVLSPIPAFMDVGSVWLVLCVVFLAVSGYIVEIVRGTLKALERFFQLGVFGLLWMLGRFVFGIAALAAFGKAWIGLLAITLSGFIATLGYYTHLRRMSIEDVAERDTPAPVKARALIFFSLSYAFVFTLAYLDVVAAYFILDDVAFGAYSAAAAISKGIYTLSMPIMQVMFPMLVGTLDANHVRNIMVRSMLITLAICGFAAAAVALTADTLCGTLFHNSPCSGEVMAILAMGVPAAALMRGVVLAQLASGRDAVALTISMPLIGFLVYQIVFGTGSSQLAFDYLVFTGALFVIYLLFALWGLRIRGRSH